MNINVATPYLPVVEKFFQRNPYHHTIVDGPDGLRIHIPSAGLSSQETLQIRLHFKYLSLFTWIGADIDDVLFWERAELFKDITADFQVLTSGMEYDFFAPLEARGFLLAGILAGQLETPMLPVRKYKPFYKNFPGTTVEFVNWKKEPEALYIFSREGYEGKRVLVIDDLIETGNSLDATVQGLAEIGCEAVGAFYLCDVMRPEARKGLSIPVHAFIHL
jgi:adenine/guanine phosphoribosyltransferase-like PRPP-binding protein